MESSTMLRAEFRYHPAIVERIKRIPGCQFDADLKCWYLPALHIEQVFELFPKAQFAPVVFELAVDVPRRRAELFFGNLEALGVELALDVAGNVVAPNLDSRHILHDVLRERSAWLRPYVQEQMTKSGENGAAGYLGTDNAQSRHANAENSSASQGCSTSGDEREARIEAATLKGLRNAVTEAERKRQIVRRQWERKREAAEQMRMDLK